MATICLADFVYLTCMLIHVDTVTQARRLCNKFIEIEFVTPPPLPEPVPDSPSSIKNKQKSHRHYESTRYTCTCTCSTCTEDNSANIFPPILTSISRTFASGTYIHKLHVYILMHVYVVLMLFSHSGLIRVKRSHSRACKVKVQPQLKHEHSSFITGMYMYTNVVCF